MESNYLEIGRVLKTHGYKGQLKISLNIEKLEHPEAIKAFYFKEGNSFVPYFVQQINTVVDNTAIVDFESFDNKESASLVVGYSLYADMKDVNQDKLPSIQEDFTNYIGYMIFDQSLGRIGTVSEVIVHPHQIFAIIMKDTREVLIPLHPELVKEIIEEEKKIMMNLPEGILDL